MAKKSSKTSATRQRVNLEIDPCRRALAHAIHDRFTSLTSDIALSIESVAELLERPPDPKMGDYALPCFRFAKALGKSPSDCALAISEDITSRTEWISETRVIGPFLNFVIDIEVLARTTLPEILDGSWFQSLKQTPISETVMIEYSQPNTHKEFHVGHGRNVCLGNSLVRIFRYCGYPVVAANYFGDEGTHIAKILWYLQRQKLEAPPNNRGEWLGKIYAETIRFLEDASPEERKAHDLEISQTLAAVEKKQGDIYDKWLETREWSLEDFNKIYDWLDVHFDVLFHESDVSEESQRIVDEYLDAGVFKLDDGAVGADLKAYKLGFMIARKRDGNTLYATKDLALARRKFDDFNIDRSIYVVADEQNHHFRQVFKVLDLMGFQQAARCHHVSYGMVVLPEGKMSSRDGNSVSFVELMRIVEAEVHRVMKEAKTDWSDQDFSQTVHWIAEGAIKYGMLETDPSREIVFNLDDWTAFEGNSGPYLMYTYARTRSIIRKAQAAGIPYSHDAIHPRLLAEDTEKQLLLGMYDFNDVVATACLNYKPSHLAGHLFSLCKTFNRFYADVSVLKAESPELINTRLGLVDGFGLTLKVGLGLLGIRAPEKM